MTWSEAQAIDRWLSDLDALEGAAELVSERLQEADPSAGAGAREAAYRDAARRWLGRGRGDVALALLERSTSAGSAEQTAAPTGASALENDVEVMLAGLPGDAGLPALTADERARLVASADPGEALAVLRVARKRLAVHGEEARRLLRNWLERRD